MKVRNAQRHGDEEIELQMTPMIDIVFLLLIFFILTFKIVSPEGDFNVTMPENAPSEGEPPEDQVPPIVIHLECYDNGKLRSISINDPSTADNRKVFPKFADLNVFLRGIIDDSGGPGSAGAAATEVELDCSPDLHFEYVIDAITAISGYIDKDNTVQTMIEKIKFTPPPEKKP